MSEEIEQQPEASEPTSSPEPEREDAPAEEAPEARSWVFLALALVVPLAFFFILPPLTKAGLWDPHELNVADLARRIALNLHGATNLSLEGADNSLPHLNDLGRPQLPFTSIALGFKIFGLHEWAGRAPLALWGLVGVVVTYAFVARLVDRRAGLFSAVALTTMPLYFVEARTMLGDIVTMSAFAMAFGGLAVAVFGHRDEDADDLRTRGLWFVVGLVGLVAGFYSRGAFVSVAAPLLGIGIAYVLARANTLWRFDSLANGVGALAAVVGLGVAAVALSAIATTERASDLNPLVGAMIRAPQRYPTFDFEIGHIAEGLLPWSGFAPFALGRLFLAPSPKREGAFERESAARVALIAGAGVAFAAHGWIAARTELMAFAAPAVIAAACGVALRDYDRGAHPSVAVGVGTTVLLGTFHHELHNLPEKAFNAFAVAGATFPESFKAHSLSIWNVVLMGFAGVVFLTFVEQYRTREKTPETTIWSPLDDTPREPFEPKGYLRVLLALRDAWDGMLALAYFAMVAGASLAGLAVWVGTRQHAKWLPQLGTQMRDFVLNAWWITAFVPLVVIFGFFFLGDVWVWTFERARPLSKSSFGRGFEPFENLAAELKKGRLGETVPKLIMGKLVVTPDALDDGIGATALFLLVPFLYLAVPGATFFALYHFGQLKLLVALALAIPSGVALFLVLGVIGDMFQGRRAAFLATFGVVVGAIMCFSYYPALANQLSPKEVFESYQRVRHGQEPLALFGVGGRTAAYYAGGQPLILKDATAAYDWLTGGDPGSRRFLAVRAEELSRLNRAWREHGNPGNLPVLDARSSQIILVASKLEASEKNQNPLSKIVLTGEPKPQRKLDVNFDDKLEVLGFDVTDEGGRLVDHIAPGKKYHLKTYFKVLAPIQTEWEMFIHIDGFHRRHNGDHKICEGKYPMSLWLTGDYVVDDYAFTLEPNFSPGPYTNFFGLFVGDSRLPVKSGPNDGTNRVNGGTLRVQ